MNLYLHFPTNLELLELYAENKEYVVGGNSKSEKEIAHFFLDAFPGEIMNEQSPQYETNFLAIRKLKKIDKDIFNKVRGIYYGSDNCEYLAPTKNEIEKALFLFTQIRKRDSIEGGFTLVTPYVGEKMLERLKEGLDYLNNQKTKYSIEVVVNDLGVLRYIQKECLNLKPILGRIFYKLLKTPLVDIYGNQAHIPGELVKNKKPSEIKLIRENIVKYQNKFYNSEEKGFSFFENFLNKNNLERTSLDFLGNRDKLYKKIQQTDLYYPYSVVYTGRLCDTSAIENPKKGYYATDEICPRTCFRYEIELPIKTTDYKLFQKGNAGYRIEIDLDIIEDWKKFKDNNNRLIFAPFL